MMQSFLYIMALTISLLFNQMSHPLAMGLTLLAQTLLICLLTGLLAKTFWFSYILFLIFLGGMLVLFIYVTSLASNEMFSLSTKTTLIMLVTISLTMVSVMLCDQEQIYTFMMNQEMTPTTPPYPQSTENMTILNKLYNFPTNIITILMMNYLLLTLIAVVKVTNVFQGPLRTMN